MEEDELWIDSKLTEPLPNKAIIEYFAKYHNGDLNAKKQIILHNVRLVFREVERKFRTTPYAKNELISNGLIGLIKSVNTFDLSRNNRFSSYAVKCIDNEILMFLKRCPNQTFNISLEEPIGLDYNCENITLKDTLPNPDYDLALIVERRNIYQKAIQIINMMPLQTKEIMELYFGLKNNEPITQKEIAIRYGLSRFQIASIIAKTLAQIKQELEFNKSQPKLSRRKII